MSIAIPPEASRSVAGMSPQNESVEVCAIGFGRGLGVRWRFHSCAAIRTHAERARGGFTPRAPARAGAKVISERG